MLTACAPGAPGGASGGSSAPAAKAGPTGVKLAELGRDYLAYPEVKGTVQFSNCWGAARIPLVEGWIKDFNTIYPGITVENDVTDCPPLQQKQVTAIAGGKSSPHVQYATYTFPRNAKNPESKGNTPSTGGWMFSIAKAGQDHAAAWEWIKFTTTSKYACGFVKAQDRPSPAIMCNEDPELAKKNPFWPVVTKDLAQGISVPTTTVHPQFIQLWYEMEDAILLERMPPKQALDSFAARGQTMLDEWNAKRK